MTLPTPAPMLTYFGIDVLIDEETARHPRRRARIRRRQVRPHIADWYEQGELPARGAGQGARRRSVCSACTSRATAARAPTPSPTAWPAWSWRPATPGIRSLVSVQGSLADVRDLALRLRGAEAAVAAADGGGRGDRLLRPDRARLRLRTRPACAPARAATAATGCSTAPRCGSPTARSPTSPSCGRRPTTGIRGFVVPDRHRRASPPRRSRSKLSLRASVTSELVLDGRTAARGRDAARGAPGLRGPLSLPERGAVRHRLRRARRGARLPGDRRSRTPASRRDLRQAARRPSSSPRPSSPT